MDTRRSLEILTKWRAHFAGWQLGSRPKGDPESDAVRDHRELTILLRAEQSALTGLLMAKSVITAEEYTTALGKEAEQLNADYERRWPGVTAGIDGLTYDPQRIQAAGWMRGWKP